MTGISKAEAKEIAKRFCEQQGWPWSLFEPVSIRWGLSTYTVWGGHRKGGNLIMRIRKRDGEIIEVAMTPC